MTDSAAASSTSAHLTVQNCMVSGNTVTDRIRWRDLQRRHAHCQREHHHLRQLGQLWRGDRQRRGWHAVGDRQHPVRQPRRCGGGLYNFFKATANVMSSTVSGNTASVAGGGIDNAGKLAVGGTVFIGNMPDNIFGNYMDKKGNTFH